MTYIAQERALQALRFDGVPIEEAAERVGVKLAYAVQLPNGLETYAKDRAEAETLFQHCAAVGHCALVAIAFCQRFYLGCSIRQTYAPTLGHYEQAAMRAKRGEPVYTY